MRILQFVALIFPLLGWGQNNTVFQLWNEVGVGYKIDKKQQIGLDLTTRFDNLGLNTYFPQLSYKYKINKNIRPSIDYRFIGDRSKYGSFIEKHRLNLNLQLSKDINRFEFDLRLRYQYSSNRLVANIEPEFGRAIRFRPSLAYNVKNIKLTPQFSSEFFTGPMDYQKGYHLNRIRWKLGMSYAFDGPSQIEVAYFYDQRISDPGALNRAILNLSYNYQIKNKSKSSKNRNPRSL